MLRKKTLTYIVLTVFAIFFFKSCFGSKDMVSNQEMSANIISGFEQVKPWDIYPERGFSLKRSKKHVTQGKYSLEVVYPTDGLPSINTKRLKQNWGNYEYFAFDVFNDQDQSLDFRIRLDDTSRKRTNISRRLTPGLNKIKIARSRIASKVDAANIGRVVLFLHEPKKRYRLYFDNMRLERSDLLPGLDEAGLPGAKFASVRKYVPGKPLPVRRAVELPKPPVETKGSLKIAMAKLQEVKDNRPLISGGIPFAPGQLKSEKDISFFNKEGKELSVAVKTLARWPQDQSIRSVLVQFPFTIQNIYEYVTMKWGQPRRTRDLKIVEPAWEYPQGSFVLPREWLCASLVIGEQVPFGQRMIPAYDEKIEKTFPKIKNIGWTGNLGRDGYYSTPHVFYQFYVRSGELKYFLAARKELLHYRETQIVHEGKNRGQSTAGGKPRYIYIEAMADDYFLTGDPRTLEVAGYMAEFLQRFKASDAFYAKNRKNFWTERRYAAPFLGILTYYEMTNDPQYLKIADEYMKNLYKTQLEWPSRGGFIHNLYAHDPEEGARPDEYGGSPFMTGLLLEPIIKYHSLTGSDIAADSIFRALDWLIAEGLSTSGDAFKYLTVDKYLDSPGAPDLNLSIAHALGYGYKISGYKNEEYLDVGLKIFNKGVRGAYLGTRKHFNQNFRSSGHFLAYIQGGLQQRRASEKKEGSKIEDRNILFSAGFERSLKNFQTSGDVNLKVDPDNVYLNGNSLHSQARFMSSNLSFGMGVEHWDLERFPILSFSYRIPPGTPVGMQVQTQYGDWICIGGTSTSRCGITEAKVKHDLIDDGKWHEISIDVRNSTRSVLASVKRLAGFQFRTAGNAKVKDEFWIDDFRIRK